MAQLIMDWINEECDLQCRGFSPGTVQIMLGPPPRVTSVPTLLVSPNPSCAEFLEMSRLAKIRVPLHTQLEPPLFAICDGRLLSLEEEAVARELAIMDAEAPAFLKQFGFG